MIAAGQTVGNYRILNKIGTGGMGAVYLAEHPLIGKRVALKVIHRELAGNRDVVSRFFQEARSVNKIGNEHIVEIHDFGVTPEGDHFFIMEYLEGRTLASILSREKALEIMRALHVGAQIAAALAAAHVAGIIHRDLKPDNIMLMSRLGDQDFVKVLDFGLAKVFSAATAVKTAAGVLLGTPQYMSPEACESKGDVDHRTDIYALGVLLFQMMTGVLPFDGESMGEVLVKQVTALPPVPRALNPAIPPSVEQILLRCLAKRVDARFATMQQLRDALLDPEAYLRGSPPIAPARSVGSGEGAVDAKTVMVQAAALQKTRVAAPQGMPLPLPAPAVSMFGAPMAPPGGPQVAGQAATILAGGSVEYAPPRRAPSAMPWLAPPLEPKMNTMRIATPLGYSSRPPRKVWPLVLVGSLLLGLAGGIFAVARFGHAGGPAAGSDVAATGSGTAGSDGAAAAGSAIAGTGSAGAGSSTGTAGAGSDAASAGHAPDGTAEPHTAGSAGTGSADPVAGTAGSKPSSAGTGSGASSGATAGTGSGASSGATAGTGSGASPGATAGTGSGASPGAGTGSAAAARPASTVRLSIDSVPPGASVAGPDGEALGKTPLKIDWPISDLPVTFELRLGGYKKKQRQTVINSNTALHVELERLPVIHHPPATPTHPGSNDPDNGLMRP